VAHKCFHHTSTASSYYDLLLAMGFRIDFSLILIGELTNEVGRRSGRLLLAVFRHFVFSNVFILSGVFAEVLGTRRVDLLNALSILLEFYPK
jgi:hypothetical protein